MFLIDEGRDFSGEIVLGEYYVLETQWFILPHISKNKKKNEKNQRVVYREVSLTADVLTLLRHMITSSLIM